VQIQTLNEQEWERMQQAHVLANVQQAFSSGGAAEAAQPATGLMNGVGGPSASGFAELEGAAPSMSSSALFAGASAELLSPSAQTDAQTLAMMLQDQLDAINNEIRCGHSVSLQCLPTLLLPSG